jgi:hypothetical protein
MRSRRSCHHAAQEEDAAMLRSLSGMLVLLLGCGAALAAEDAVLLGSTAPGYSQGMVLGLEDRLRIPEGASLTLLLRSGQVLRLRGPLDAAVERSLGEARGTGSATALAEALRLRGIDASAIGGTRTASPLGPARPQPQEVPVDIGRSGTYCIGTADTIWLTQPPAERPAIALRRGGNRRSLAWPKGAARIEWPADISIEDGDRFEVLMADRPMAVLTFRMPLTDATSDPRSLAEALLLGCREQHAAALRRLAASLLPLDIFLVSDRGHSPRYRPGETVRFGVLAAVDGWLYCVTQRSNGGLVPLFPRAPGQSTRWTTRQGEQRDIVFQAGPVGDERIRCWFVDRDISQELPPGLLAGHGEHLPERLGETLDDSFSAITAGRVGAAQLDLRVDDQ